MINENFAILAALLSTFGGLSYFIYTLQGKVKPNKVTYFIWALAALTVFAAQIKEGVGMQSWLAFSVGFPPLLTFIASFFIKNAKWQISKLDLICGAFSIIGIILWFITKTGNYAIFFNIAADALAAVPTVIKTYNYPKTEKGWTYLTSSLGAGIVIFTITNWNFENFAFPLYSFIINFIIFTLAQFRPGKSKD